MGIKETARAIKHLVENRKAFVEIVAGPRLTSRLDFDECTFAFPLGPLGNHDIIDFGTRLVNALGVSTDAEFVAEAHRQGQPFHDLTAIVYVGLAESELALARAGSGPRINRIRALLSFYTAARQYPLIRFDWLEPRSGTVEFLGPKYRGLGGRRGLDPISPNFIVRCATDKLNDDRLHYFIEMLEQAYSLDDENFRIARYFSVLESMAGPLSAQFEQQGCAHMSRTAIRFMLGYFSEFDIPRFTIQSDKDYEFDHIELAGRIRDKIFHGGGKLTADDVSQALRPGLGVLALRADLISHQIRKDCELEISRWASGESRARR
ncbi:hypothetical protein, partial [Rhodopirellula bahusiensis]|uniref:hypothetical protein n=1 Tax=Rhodopirellula bahusiensis TaxID=2014065 RepID=UPI0032664918